MRNALKFFRNKENRELISWIGGGFLAVGSLAFSAMNYFLPREQPAIQATVSTQALPAVESRCASQAEIVTNKDGFVFPDSHERLVTSAEIAKLSECQKWIARNEIFARKGRFFKTQILHIHFSSFAWYEPKNPPPVLNETELENVARIQAQERK